MTKRVNTKYTNSYAKKTVFIYMKYFMLQVNLPMRNLNKWISMHEKL